jgi:alkylation response protein AidB-like acyl-CoA dehydrogenase
MIPPGAADAGRKRNWHAPVGRRTTCASGSPRSTAAAPVSPRSRAAGDDGLPDARSFGRFPAPVHPPPLFGPADDEPLERGVERARVRGDLDAGIAKLYSTEIANECALDAMRIHGGVGYSKELPLERYYRDAPLMIVAEGTSDIQKTVIARSIVKEYPI